MRRLFRLHLFTVLVLMLIAGVFLGVNMAEHKREREGVSVVYRGWPYPFQITSQFDWRAEMDEKNLKVRRFADIENPLEYKVLSDELSQFARRIRVLKELYTEIFNVPYSTDSTPQFGKRVAFNAALAIVAMLLDV